MHLPTIAALRLLSAPRLLETLARFAQDNDCELVETEDPLDAALTEALRLELKISCGGVPVAQIDGAVKALNPSLEGQKSPLLFGALRVLSGRFLQWGRDEVQLCPDNLLEFQEHLERILPDQLTAFALRVRTLPQDPPDGSPRQIDSSTLRHWIHDRLIPAPGLPLFHLLEQEGLPELHRHDSLTRLPMLLWSELVRDPGRTLPKLRSDMPGWLDRPRVEGLTNRRLNELFRAAMRIRTHLCQQWLSGQGPDSARRDDWSSRKGDDCSSQKRNETSSQKRDERSSHKKDETSSQAARGGNHAIVRGSGRKREAWRGLLEGLARPETLLEQLEPSGGLVCPTDLELHDIAALLPGGEDRPPFGERAFLAEAFRRLTRAPFDPALRALLHAYLLIQNLWNRAFVQPRHTEEGLERFVKDFAQDPRQKRIGGRDRTEQLVQASRTGRVRWLELRIAPGGVREKIRRLELAVSELAAPDDQDSIARVMDRPPALHDLRQPRAQDDLPAVGIIIHFLKKAEKVRGPFWPDLPGGYHMIRHYGLRRQLQREEWEVARAMNDPACARHIVGLDVAALETDAPIEVFAPTICFLRRPFRRIEPLDEVFFGHLEPRPPLCLTCHAGEEFVHLLGGLRAIDETVRFLKMGAGDRLGHALALGLSPEQWARRVGVEIRIKRGAWLDDLVWFHFRLAQAGNWGDVCRELERKIEGLASRVYGGGGVSDTSPNLDLLQRAWFMRGEDPLAGAPAGLDSSVFGLSSVDAILAGLADDGRGLIARRSREEARDRYGRDAEHLWWRYHTDPAVRASCEEVVAVEILREWFPAIDAVQTQMTLELKRRGLVIEVNPTSNLCIGPLDDLTEHPIFRWAGPEKSAAEGIPVVVGSDDPSIFGSELTHEYAFLGAAALRRGHDINTTIRWLERLRDAGTRYTFIRPPPPHA